MKLYSSLPSAMMETTRGGARGKRQTCCVDSRARESGSSAVSLFILIRIIIYRRGCGSLFFLFLLFSFFCLLFSTSEDEEVFEKFEKRSLPFFRSI